MHLIETSDQLPQEGKVVFTRLPFDKILPGKVSYVVMYYRNNMWYWAGARDMGGIYGTTSCVLEWLDPTA